MPQSVYGLLGLLHLILWIIAAVEILRSSRPVTEKVIWHKGARTHEPAQLLLFLSDA